MLSIINEALGLLGEAPIQSEEDGSVPATLAVPRLGFLADKLLAAHPWPWSRRAAVLPRTSLAVPPGLDMAHAYDEPEDLFTLRALLAPGGGDVPAWQRLLIGDRAVILSDAPAVTCLYHGRVPSTLFPPVFRSALVYHLASDLSLALREDAGAQRTYYDMGLRELAAARAATATEEPVRVLTTPRRWRDAYGRGRWTAGDFEGLR